MKNIFVYIVVDEDILLTSLTESVNIDYLDLRDTIPNYNATERTYVFTPCYWQISGPKLNFEYKVYWY